MKNISALLFFIIPMVCFSQQENISVYFEFNKQNLDSFSQKMIHDAIFNRNISVISIEAHCDSVGSNRYNDALSLRRANEVKAYLVSENISEKIITVSGFGKRKPVNKNETEQDRALNRRAEI